MNYEMDYTFFRMQISIKYLLAVIGFFFSLQSCTQKGPNESARSSSPEVQFITPWQPGGGMGLYVRTSGEPHPVQENILNFTTINRRQFSQKGIPAKAIAAGSFLEAGDSKADLQAIYMIKVDGQVQVFRGYFVPGFGGPVEWNQVKL